MEADPFAPAAPSSPVITTKQILGASSSGWSPQRQVNRTFVPLNGSAKSNSPLDSGSPRKSFAVLKSHSLVSNSVFRQGGSGSDSPGEPPMPSPPSPQKSGVGLGIGVSGTPARSHITPRLGPAFTPRKLSGERVGSGSHGGNAENQVPSGGDVFGTRPTAALAHARQSKGIDVLAKGSFVSNSPFKQTASPEATRPLQPRNAWAMTAEAQASSRRSPGTESSGPTRPLSLQLTQGPGITLQGRMYQSPEMIEDHSATPRSSQHVKRASVEVKDSGSRGALVSNRLHGPRQMAVPTIGQTVADLRAERRKTVTFDEILEVQEFDKESSFDRDSTRSEGSRLSQETGTPLSDSGQWPSAGSADRLQVINGPVGTSPANSVSEELPPLMPSSGSSSSDASTFDELPDIVQMQHQPQVLQQSSSLGSIPSQYSEDLSFEPARPFANKGPGAADESFNSLTGLHRVDSLVDELLHGDILNTGSEVPEEQPRRRSHRPQSVPQVHSPMLNQQDNTPGPTSRALPVPPTSAVQDSLTPKDLPDLPNWSPFVLPEGTLSDLELGNVSAPVADPEAATSSPSRASGGRPRIARDTVLERVRAVKQEESHTGLEGDQTHDQVPSSQTHTAALVDPDMLAKPQALSRTISTPVHAQRDGSPKRPAPQATSSFEARAAPPPSPVRHGVSAESPLDRLSAEVAIEVEDLRRSSQDEGTNYLQTPQDAARAGPASGRVSPSSMLSPPPPPVTPAEQNERIIARRRSKNGGSMRRKRSLSAGDAAQIARDARAELQQSSEVGDDSFFERHRLTAEEEMESRESIGADLAISKAMLDQSLKTGFNVPFTTGMERELNRIYKDTDAKYNTIDRGVIKGVDDKVRTTSAGDVDSGKAWRRLRRPSDMNEYAQELREIRESNGNKKPLGKIFVMVDSFIPAQLPIPGRQTRFYCVLDNGLHMVKTGLANLVPGGQPSPIGQEFELIQHKNLEFSFTLVAVRDPHLVEPAKLPAMPTSPKKQKTSPSLAKGVSRLFGSPKKQASKILSDNASIGSPQQSSQYVEPMLAYMNREGAFGRTRILFEELQDRCLGTCATFDCAVMGVAEPVGSISAASRLGTLSYSAAFEQNLGKVRGKLRLKIFYLPPIPNIPRNLLPDSLAECVQGMQAAVSQKIHVWMEGTLTQNGGDCKSWRRRPIQAQGTSLICFNEITRRPIVKIDLSKAVKIEDNFDPVDPALVSPTGGATSAPRAKSTASALEDLDENYHVERSFRITFGDGERISFFADTDEEKDRWLVALREVIGKPSPAAPLWAHAAHDMLRRIADGTFDPHAETGITTSAPAQPHDFGTGASGSRPTNSMNKPSSMRRGAEAAIPEELSSSPQRAAPASSQPMHRASMDQAPAMTMGPLPGRALPDQRPPIPARSFTQQGDVFGTAPLPTGGQQAPRVGTPEQRRPLPASTPARAVHMDTTTPMAPPPSAGRGRGTPGAVARRPVPMP